MGSNIQPDSLAKAVGMGVKNVAQAPDIFVLPRKILVIGAYDPLKLTVVDDVPVQVTSPEDGGSKFGFGFMIYSLLSKVFLGSNGEIPVYVSPQSELGGAVGATGSIDFATSAGVVAGVIPLYIAADRVKNFNVADGATPAEIVTAGAAAINAIKELHVTAVANLTVLELTEKTLGTWGNDTSIKFSLNVGDSLPTGVAGVITPMAGGLTVPDIQTALVALGEDDDANADHYTDVVHGYQQDTDTLDAISAYVGEGNELTGLYSELVARPFRVLTGDVVADTAGLDALIVISDTRLTDRANGIVPAPGSPTHPSEVAANAIGEIARISNVRAEESYENVILAGVFPGEKADRWTKDYLTGRDRAVRNGIGTTRVIGGAVTLQDVITFYRPEDVPVESNGYRSMRNIAITQNILHSSTVIFTSEKWSGISIVEDVSEVTDIQSKLKARDINTVRQELVQLIGKWVQKAWLYNSALPLAELKKPGSIVIRPGGNGFDFTLRVIYSGEGGIIDGAVEFDISLAAVLG